MGKDKRPEGRSGRSKHALPPSAIKDALKHASDRDLIDEALRRGLITKAHHASTPGDKTTADRATMRREALRREELRERRRRSQGQQVDDDIDAAIAALDASVAHHHQYVGGLFDVLRRKRLDKMRKLGVRREDTDPEFAALGKNLTKAIFDHLVIARRDALDAGACDIESLWAYLMGDAGCGFASGMIRGDIAMPPDLRVSFISFADGDCRILSGRRKSALRGGFA